jgi:acetyltransferase-like isoleucine patch superfamily enzyme
MILIGGLGGNCKDSLIDLLNHYDAGNIAFYTDFASDKNLEYFKEKGLRLIIGGNELQRHFGADKRFISYLGNNYSREKQVRELQSAGGIADRHISKTAMVNPAFSQISTQNVIIMHFANVSAGSSISEGAIIYAYTAIAHDVHIGKYVFISAHCAVSNSVIGDYTFVGLNTMIGPGVIIGKNCIIGANSYVKHNLPDNAIAAGSPAKIIRYSK